MNKKDNMIKKLTIDNALRPADVVIAKKRTGLGRILNHYIVYVGENTFIGNLKNGVRILSHDDLETLLLEYEPIRIKPFTGTDLERNHAIERAYSKLGKNYNLVTFNCEHYANLVQNGVARSFQVIVAIIAILFVGLVYKLLNTDNGKR